MCVCVLIVSTLGNNRCQISEINSEMRMDSGVESRYAVHSIIPGNFPFYLNGGSRSLPEKWNWIIHILNNELVINYRSIKLM